MKAKETIILFDLDGTLIDSTDAIVETFYYTFDKFDLNINIPQQDIIKLIGYPLEIMYERLGVEKNLIDSIVLAYKHRYRDISSSKTTLLDGAIQSIQEAYKIATLGIVTTKTKQYTMPLLHHLDIVKYFDTIVGRMEVTHPKPHPEPILKALENLNVTKSNHNIYMIGDTKLDLICANESDVEAVGVLSGYGTKDELELYTKLIFDNSLDAVKYITSLHK
jgi:phosphoglycolate phosphatase